MIRFPTWFLLCTLVLPVKAHVGSNVASIFELPSEDLPDIHDRSLDDWEDVVSSVAFAHVNFTSLESVAAGDVDPASLAFRIFLAWHDKGNHLYAAIERVDDAYVNTYPGGNPTRLFEYGGIELMVDGDHSGGQYAKFAGVSDAEQKDLTNFQAQQYFAIPESPDNNILGYSGAGTGWVVFPPYGDAGGFSDGRESPNTSIIELYLTPWDELDWRGPERSRATDLQPGKIIGIQISVPDFDRGCWSCVTPSYDGFFTLFGVPGTFSQADGFVDAELVPCNRGDCSRASSTITEVDPWARIKASFR